MEILRTADQVNFGAGLTQKRLEHDVKSLSTGLRINTAGDDPSGLAIAESLQSRVNGLKSGEVDLADGVNALTVAEGAMSTVASILQRMRSLVVQSASDLNSPNDLTLIQTELDQLKHEIMTVGQNTTYNGRPLLDGSLNTTPAQPIRVVQVAAQAPDIPGGNGLVRSTCVNADALGNPGPLLSSVTASNGTPPTFIEVSVTGYDPVNAVDPVTGPLGQPGVYLRTIMYGDDPSWGPQIDITSAVPVGPPLGPGPFPSSQNNGNNTFAINFTLANLSPQDVGTSMAFQLYPNTAQGTGQAAQINVGRAEGDTVTAQAPDILALGRSVANITVTAPLVTSGAFGAPVSQNTTNTVSDRYNLIIMDDAMETLGNGRAIMGAQMVALTNAGQNAGIDEANTQAAESTERDLNIGQATTSLTKDQTLVQIQTQVLRQVQSLAQTNADTLDKSIRG